MSFRLKRSMLQCCMLTILLHSVSWVDQSKIRKHIARYTGEHDDYDLL